MRHSKKTVAQVRAEAKATAMNIGVHFKCPACGVIVIRHTDKKVISSFCESKGMDVKLKRTTKKTTEDKCQ
jgi:predicted RNA-binding Zn-ribbon protein involved in translation (DUF1610 family)